MIFLGWKLKVAASPIFPAKLLKNFEPLLGIEFCYKWSTQKGAHNGFLRFFKESNILKTIILKNDINFSKKK